MKKCATTIRLSSADGQTVNTGIVGQNGNAFRKSTSIDFHRGQFPMTAFALPKGSIRRPPGRGPGREARLHVQRGKVDAGLRRTYDRNVQRKRLRKEWPPWPIFCTMMATAAPRPIPATSSGFAHTTSARSNRVVIENDDRMVLGLQDAAKGVVAAGRGGAGIANNVLLGVSDDCPASGHHARTQRGRQRVDPAYGTPAGCCTGARPGNTPKNNHNGSTTRARSAVCNANIGRTTMCGRFRRLHVMRERGAPLWGHREGIKLLITASPCRVP